MSYIGNQSGKIVYTNLNKFKGVVADLTALEAVTGASSGDMYKVEDSGHAHMYDGTQWVDMGPIGGPQGVKGTGITSIVRTSGDGSEGTVDTYTITYDDTSTSTFEVHNGTAGTIDHIAKTGTVGVTDTYTAYADVAETQPLGSFEVYNGIDGLSAYGVAAANGFVGTEAEWLTSLGGQDGIDGKAITTVTFTSTTDASGLPAQSGGIDTYTINYSDTTTSTYDVYNGTDADNASVINDTESALTSTWSSEKIAQELAEAGEVEEAPVDDKAYARKNAGWVEIKAGVPVPSTLEYGLVWDDVNDTYTRTGDAAGWSTGADFTNNETVQSKMKRCVLNSDGTVKYYLNPVNSNLKEDGSASNLTGADGNVMVEIPKFWVKYENTTGAKSMSISTAPASGYGLHPAFIKNGVEVDYRYYRAYTGSVSGTKLISRSGVSAAAKETIEAFRTKARANGTGWGLLDWYLLFAVQTLLFVEIGTFDSQAVLGNGNDTGADYGMTTGGSNGIGNGSSPSTNDDTWMSYRGIENFYADIREWVDGINVSDKLVYVSNMESTFSSDVFSGDYVSTEVTLPVSGYIKDMDFSIKGFIPTVSGGSDSTYVPDQVYSGAGSRVVAFGGFAGNGLRSGAAYLFANYAVSHSAAILGAGLSF